MLLLLQDVVDDLIGWQMLEILLSIWIFDIKVSRRENRILVILQYIFGRHFPGALVLLSALPPFQAIREFFKLHGLSFRVLASTLRKRLLVIPNILCGTRTIKKEQIRWNRGIRCEHAIG